MEISAVILTRGDRNLEALKKSLYFCSEILVLTDPNITDFAKARNEGLRKAKNDWVLFIDSDEVVPQALASEIVLVTKNVSDCDGYYITRRDYFFGKELRHGEFSGFGWFGNSKLVRLGRKGSGKWERAVHEEWKIKGKLRSLKNPLSHYPHTDLRSFIANINYFSILHAKALKKEGKRSSLIKIIVWPPGKLFYNLVFRFGFMDGIEGFVAALMMSFHSFLSWSKLYLWQRELN